MSELIFTDSVSETFKSYCSVHNISNAFIICDSNTKQYCLPILGSVDFPVITIPSGEQNKNLNTSEQIFKELVSLGANRKTVLINLGGGVVSDIGGFCASVYQRGIEFINIPTTLLAMVDASIGGKTGIDYLNLKNFIGSFSLPKSIIIGTEFLKTLDKDEIRSAGAEMIKIATINNRDLFEKIESGSDFEDVVRDSAETKNRVISSDLKDKNQRQLLNFGHTIGHAYESYRLSINQPVKHGYAVAKGMLMETEIAVSLGILQPREADRICNLILRNVSSEILLSQEFEGLLNYITADKKNNNGNISFSLPVAIGKGQYGVEMSLDELKKWKNRDISKKHL